MLLQVSRAVSVPHVPESRQLILKAAPVERHKRLDHLPDLLLAQLAVTVDVNGAEPAAGIDGEFGDRHDAIVFGAADWAGGAAVVAVEKRLGARLAMKKVTADPAAVFGQHRARGIAQGVVADAALGMFDGRRHVACGVRRDESRARVGHGRHLFQIEMLHGHYHPARELDEHATFIASGVVFKGGNFDDVSHASVVFGGSREALQAHF
mmetsp:Transcript_21605/g.53306  ORF Transcript_21605/g.53306 Transcript_21605/m.53306 type:complete len:209 (+) Transcript_21605:649-1275(+)